MPLKVSIPLETSPLERRVAIVPQLVKEYQKLGCELIIEKRAGKNAGYLDDQYLEVTWADNLQMVYQADLILKVQPPTEEEIRLIPPKAIVISFLFPNRSKDKIAQLKANNITSFAMDRIPRISRAQSLDALSSQATVAGYRAVLAAAELSNRFWPMLTTAAGTIRPIIITVVGTGVAGLQAIATARRLGAIVQAYDIRIATKEQVESLGAKMIETGISAESTGGYARELTNEEKNKQQEILLEHLINSQIIITTAQIPGKTAPKILTQSMIEQLSPGTIIVDIAAESGGNCELSEKDKIVRHHDITIYGPTNLPSTLAYDASYLYARNIFNFVKLLISNGQIHIDFNDEILKQSVVTHEGETYVDP